MIGGVNSASSQLARAYSIGTEQLTSTLTKIATGKKFQNAAEDLLGFVKTANLQVDISGYQKVKEDLTEAKAFTAAALQAGSSIYEKLTKMKDLATKYDAETDADKQEKYKADFDALKEEINSIVSNTRVDGTVVTDTAEVVKVNLDPDGTGSLSVTFTSVADATSLDIEDSETVDTQITAALTYLSEAKAFDNIIGQQIKLTDTIIASKQAVEQLVSGIDEAEEMSKAIDQQVRQQAAISMLSQANLSRQAITRLYMYYLGN